MDSIKLMVDEHENILRMNIVIRKACEKILDGSEVCTADFRKMIDFIRNYADKHHHGKEEQILFIEMQDRLGNIGANLIKHGMLVEHDLGRLFVTELEEAIDEYEKQPSTPAKLDILANAVSYTGLLARHIGKENEVVYTYAQKNLTADVLADVNQRTEDFEKAAEDAGIVKKYLSLLLALENKYR